ncbi:type II secretion system secretin GspD [Alterisphingorhabdus coralli]|uniref:type II secretion system secretin GspD n=1 Tax=Alterisphingorhabdus coralli TaxID=3071408 RepID=UPI0038738A12
MALLAASAALCFSAPAPVYAQHVLNVRDADVRAFIADAAEVTGRTFVVDSRVQGTVSVVTDRPLSRSEYFEIFLSTLRANGLVAVPTSGGAYRIQPADSAASQPGRVGSENAARNQFVTEVFRLKSIDATSAVETLKPLVSREGSVTANIAANSLVVADFADNVRRIRALIARIDKDNATTQLISLENAGAREIALALQQLVPARQGQAPAVSVVPVDSSNSIAMRGDPATLGRLTAIANELDAKAANGSEIRVIWLDYADAETLVPVLERLVGQQPSLAAGDDGPVGAAPVAAAAGQAGDNRAITGTPGRGPSIITRYPGTNAIIISAPVDVQRNLAALVRQLDIRQEQVLVEAIIVEVSENVARELGVQFLVGGEDVPFLATPFSNVSPNIVDLAGGLLADEFDETTTVINGDVVTTTTNSQASDILRANAVNSVLGARGGFAGFAADLGSGSILGLLINAVQEDTDSNILSTPHIALDNNVEGSVLFGQEIPISTGEALSNNFDNAFRTIQRENVGIELIVTPQITAGNEVRLQIKQEVSSISGPVSDDFQELIINKREISTTLTVGDREIVALGGLLDDNERKTLQRIPILSDIPLIGELFKSRARSRVKTNLLVFIRPTILRTTDDARRIAARRYGYVREQQLRRNPEVEPSIDSLIRDYLGTTPPRVGVKPGDLVIQPTGIAPATPVDTTPLPESEPGRNENLPPVSGTNSEGVNQTGATSSAGSEKADADT